MKTPQLADALRAAVLQAAIKGELTARSSENARDLLLRIQNEKQTLQAKGSLKKTKAPAPVTADEAPFDIPENWVWVRLGDLAQVLNGDRGKNYPGKEFWVSEGKPFINAGSLNNGILDKSGFNYISDDRYSLLRSGFIQKNDFLYCLRGSLGKFSLNKDFDEGVIGSSLCIIRTHQSSLIPFFFYYLQTDLAQEDIKKVSNGTAQPNLSAENVRNFLIPLPPLAEQQAIAEKLTRLLAEIDRLKAEEQSLASLQKAYPQTLRASVLAAAIKGELTERSSENARDLLLRIQNEKQALQAKGSLKKTKAPAPVTADEVSFDIPENWVWVRLGDVILQNIGGGTPSKQEPSYWNGDIPWASVKDLNCDVLTKTIDSITAEGLENSSSNLIPKGTLIICTRMGLGKIALAEIDVAINQDLRAIFLPECLNKHYFYHFYRTLKMEGKGATVKGITVEELHNTPFPLPPLAEQQAIVEKLSALLAEIDALENA
ncbi:type I site-specific deoxyribonuclease [Neisseria bacilliformis ATCC BAA-1200]|uniref:Type I site-specific deoxyribonuclease n=1 Tax=Neisseria bacilliformis ATCC BAA-1200 TaxID=888742 RepID=F2BC33_9NEIS|nr:restriction endonuclease subunit S [Neisseria bacilliformis]EGF11023.1 type I site-specific deoxyribonuclease [Neisseria bacilliformis ATCC BAA-1200]QMT48324.1 restriction endonuclease subunit S [Neisseria bacilliformis]